MKVGGMFKSPMTIILVLSMAMMAFLPKMMENLDPEQLEVSPVDDEVFRYFLLFKRQRFTYYIRPACEKGRPMADRCRHIV